MAPVALITDFGLSGWYTGELKGSIISLYPDVPIHDVTHMIYPGNIRSAAFTLATCFNSFPQQTVFCIVVDPGVRSSRRALAAAIDNRYIVGPDNGVFSWVLQKGHAATLRSIDTAQVFRDVVPPLPPHSDIFGPAAAYIASGKNFAEIGPLVDDAMVLPFPETIVTPDTITTEVMEIDHFGNIITAADNRYLDGRYGKADCSIGKLSAAAPIVTCYDQAPADTPLVYRGSGGYIEVGINRGSAAVHFSARCGSNVRLLFS